MFFSSRFDLFYAKADPHTLKKVQFLVINEKTTNIFNYC